MASRSLILKLTALALACSVSAGSFAGEVEVLHYWVSGGEAKSVSELKKMVAAKGVTWRDFSVEGDTNAMATLRARIKGGNAMTAAMMKTPGILELGPDKGFADLDEVAKNGNWDGILTPAIANSQKYNGKFVATPVNVHRENWLWINTEVLAKAGATVPTTLEEFFETAEKIKRIGIIPIARGGESWQDGMILSSMILATGGPSFYRQVYIEQSPAAVLGPTMLKVFETMARVRSYTDKYAEGRNWNLATSMVIHGKGGMQFMGDWAKGEFIEKGKQPGKEFVCVASPGTANAFIYAIDSLVMLDVKGAEKKAAQSILAETIMSTEFQEVFNLNKGSIPARSGVSRAKFDSCATKSMDDMAGASKNNALVPSSSMTLSGDTSGVLSSTLFKFLNSTMTAQQAIDEMSKSLRDIAAARANPK